MNTPKEPIDLIYDASLGKANGQSGFGTAAGFSGSSMAGSGRKPALRTPDFGPSRRRSRNVPSAAPKAPRLDSTRMRR